MILAHSTASLTSCTRKIETPFYPDRDQVHKWQHWLAYCQYHISELGSGEAIRIMERYKLL